MTVFYGTLLFLSLLYFLFLDWCWLGWRKLIPYPTSAIPGNTFVTIIIPARNEERNIKNCLEDLVNQNYPSPLFEIIIVNDSSSDKTAELVSEFIKHYHERFSIRLINTFETKGKLYKKEAISMAAGSANGELIITTDADCRRNENWLSSLVSYYETYQPAMLCAPVSFNCNNSFFQMAQSLELCGLIGISGGSIAMGKPLMCNGANLAFTKEIFQRVNGYSLEKNTASGDDTLLMQKISDFSPGNIHFLKSIDATVFTKPATSLTGFFQQRKRWASKIPINMGILTITIAAIAWLFHLGLIVSLILSCVSVIPWIFFLVPFAIKIAGEFILLSSATHLVRKQNLLWLLLPAEVIYLFYVVIIGLVAPFGTYKWKERVLEVRPK